MAVIGARAARPARPFAGTPAPPRHRIPAAAYGLGLAAGGVAAAWGVHRAVPAVPLLTAAVVLGIGAAQLPGTRGLVRGRCRAGLSLAGKRLMRLGIVLLGLKLSLDDVLGLGWATVAMVFCVVAATFGGTWWLGRRMGLRGDQPLLIATGYSICGASAIGAVGEVSDSDEQDVATSVALVTLCGTLAIAVLPLLQHPLGLGDARFGRWVGASVHDVGQVVAAAQTAGPVALKEAVLVKLMRVALLAPLVAALALSVRARAGARRATAHPAAGRTAAQHRPAARRRPRYRRDGPGTPARRRPLRPRQRGRHPLPHPHRRPGRGAGPVRLGSDRGGLVRGRPAHHLTPASPRDAPPHHLNTPPHHVTHRGPWELRPTAEANHRLPTGVTPRHGSYADRHDRSRPV
jgi:uncharacterized integral membrane protein (TIGR00698 family)